MNATWEVNFEVQAGSLAEARDKADSFIAETMDTGEYYLEIEPEILTDMTIAGEHTMHVGMYGIRAWGEL